MKSLFHKPLGKYEREREKRSREKWRNVTENERGGNMTENGSGGGNMTEKGSNVIDRKRER